MKRILITGGNGYIGARLSFYLAEKGNEITVQCYPFVPDNKEWARRMHKIVAGDIRDDLFLNELVSDKFDIVIHLVSLDHFHSQKDPETVLSINVLPTWKLLYSLKSSNLQKFIYFSTIHVYGALPAAQITEEQQPNPQNAYALTHLLSEDICSYFNRISDIQCINLRLSNSFGSPVFQDANCWWLVINDLCRNAFFEKKIVISSDGSPVRDFIHYTDLCEAVNCLISMDQNNGENNCYHVSSGRSYTILKIAEIIASVYKNVFGSEIPVFINKNEKIDRFPATSSKERFIIDNSRLSALHYTPSVSLEEGIKELFYYFISLKEKHA